MIVMICKPHKHVAGDQTNNSEILVQAPTAGSLPWQGRDCLDREVGDIEGCQQFSILLVGSAYLPEADGSVVTSAQQHGPSIHFHFVDHGKMPFKYLALRIVAIDIKSPYSVVGRTAHDHVGFAEAIL